MSVDQKTIEEEISNLPLPQRVITNLTNELKTAKVTKKQLDEIKKTLYEIDKRSLASK